MQDELNLIAVFVAVAEAQGFRGAGERLGVSASAVSQSLRKLEARLGVALFKRTTRSVRLTEAGERLYESVHPALDEVRTAIAAVSEMSDAPRGTLHLLVGPAADPRFTGPLFNGFLAANRDVTLDLVVSDGIADIVAAGFDAGIQLGEVIDRDMIAVPVTGDIRMVVVGSPTYFARHAKPRHPEELTGHVCLNWRRSVQSPPYRWEFTEHAAEEEGAQRAREITVPVTARVICTDSSLNIGLACAGLGLTIVYEHQVRDEIGRGTLLSVLEEFCRPFPGYYLYYPQRRQASAALRALIEYLKRMRRA